LYRKEEIEVLTQIVILHYITRPLKNQLIQTIYVPFILFIAIIDICGELTTYIGLTGRCQE
jgi:hypothetical protein